LGLIGGGIHNVVYNGPMVTARDLILQHGWNATAYQILNPGIDHWFTPRRTAVVGYVRRRHAWVAAGAPVCRPDAIADVAASFEREAARGSRRVCYVCAAERLAEYARASPRHSVIAIGSQPVWNPAQWPAIVRTESSLRAQLSRAANKGVRIQVWNARSSIGDDALWTLRKKWLATRPMPPMGFLVESPVLSAASTDRTVLVALRANLPVGYLVASPVPVRNGCLIEQIVRCPEAPNGTAELLIDAAMGILASQGRTYVTMGLVALSTQAQQAIDGNPMWIRLLMAWARAHGRRFYHFDGLERFRAKMAPQHWETIYAIANEPHFSPATLWSMAAAFSGHSPLSMLARTLAAGVGREVAWLLNRRDSIPA